LQTVRDVIDIAGEHQRSWGREQCDARFVPVPHKKGALVLTNTPLEDNVTASLERDPRIPRPAEIAVSDDRGIVTLRGTVERFSQRRAAAEDAAKIDGVYEVVNHLKVNMLGVDSREDDELRGIALQSLSWDGDVPDSVDVKVQDGWVTLKGQVSYQYQSDAAYDDVSKLYGVYGITNEIVVSNP
jgi:osmotically-inducible protein OsmY